MKKDTLALVYATSGAANPEPSWQPAGMMVPGNSRFILSSRVLVLLIAAWHYCAFEAASES